MGLYPLPELHKSLVGCLHLDRCGSPKLPCCVLAQVLRAGAASELPRGSECTLAPLLAPSFREVNGPNPDLGSWEDES